jgi:Zn-dependent peptidase ImmA (M78 family)
MNSKYSSDPTEHNAVLALCERVAIPEPKAAIVACSLALIETCGVVGPPLSPEHLGYARGIFRVDKKDLVFDACLIPKDSGFIVEVCKFNPRARQRFSIAHEIAHTFFIEVMPELGLPKRDTGIRLHSEYNYFEHLCDIGAAELLMPGELFRRAAAEVAPGLTGILELANRFQASLNATARRLTALNLWSCMIVWSRFNEGAEDVAHKPKLVLRTTSADTPEFRSVRTFWARQVSRCLRERGIVSENVCVTNEDIRMESLRVGGEVISVIIPAKRQPRMSAQLPLFPSRSPTTRSKAADRQSRLFGR